MSTSKNYFKLILTYELIPDNIESYYQFVLGGYIPLLQQLGLEMIEAWTTSWGEGPGRHIVFASRDRDTIDKLIEDERWFALNDKLEEFVTDFEYKVIPYRVGFQL